MELNFVKGTYKDWTNNKIRVELLKYTNVEEGNVAQFETWFVLANKEIKNAWRESKITKFWCKAASLHGSERICLGLGLRMLRPEEVAKGSVTYRAGLFPRAV